MPTNMEPFVLLSLQNYTATMDFVAYFEQQCRSQARVRRLRESAPYADFMKLWSLPIYFQLRYLDHRLSEYACRCLRR